MLKKRVIPVVLIDGYSVLKTKSFQERRNQGNPIVVARTYNTRNVDELILLDIDASKQGRKIDLNTITEIASECFMPLTVGGGLRTLTDISVSLNAGADKVAINSEALINSDFIKQAVATFGSQCIVGSIDVLNQNIYSHSGKTLPSLALVEYLQHLESLGVGEILINSVERDGMMIGVDEDLIKLVSSQVRIPIIYCGGVSSPMDCVKAIEAGASAIAAASIFHFTRYVPDDCKKRMRESGIEVRLDVPKFS